MGLNQMTARDIMTPCVRTVNRESSLAEAIAVMDRERFGQLPVMNGEQPVALLTEADVRKALQEGREHLPVMDLASPLPDMVAPDTRVSGILRRLQEQETVLVVAPKGRLRGIITYWDVLTMARPHLLVKEVELLLREVVAATYTRKYGPDWWHQVPPDLREQAEQEHRRDRGESDGTPEHMLGHTSMWVLVETFRHIRPDLGDDKFEDLHAVRVMRNEVSHYYKLSPSEVAKLARHCEAMGDWLEGLK